MSAAVIFYPTQIVVPCVMVIHGPHDFGGDHRGKYIVHLQRGFLSVESTPGRGAAVMHAAVMDDFGNLVRVQ